MVERLMEALRLLAAPDFPANAGELAAAFADAWLIARQCPGLEFTSGQQALLDELDAQLWTAAAVGDRREWATARDLAGRALAALGP